MRRALDHGALCPLCRSILHITSDHAVSVTLKSIIEKNFPEEYARRAAEVSAETRQSEASMPLVCVVHYYYYALAAGGVDCASTDGFFFLHVLVLFPYCFATSNYSSFRNSNFINFAWCVFVRSLF